MEKLPLQSAVMSQLSFQHVIISHQAFRTRYLLHGLMQSADKENLNKTNYIEFFGLRIQKHNFIIVIAQIQCIKL